jgi:organic hydroperoxide reductase OsmC/OhrA
MIGLTISIGRKKDKKCCHVITSTILLIIVIAACFTTWYSFHKRTHDIDTYIKGVGDKIDLSKKTVDNDKIFKQRLDSDAKYFFDPNDGITDVSKAKEKFDNDHQTAKEIKEI